MYISPEFSYERPDAKKKRTDSIIYIKKIEIVDKQTSSMLCVNAIMSNITTLESIASFDISAYSNIDAPLSLIRHDQVLAD